MPRIVIREEELKWQGEWSLATTYPVEAVVGYDGSSYVASAVTQGDVPSAGAPWSLLASRGDTGPQGPEGPAGGSDNRYVHTQPISEAIWTINHGLSRFPAVSVTDSAGTVVVGSVRYVDANTVEITFSSAFQGKAYLN